MFGFPCLRFVVSILHQITLERAVPNICMRYDETLLHGRSMSAWGQS